jgi:hypothetical protein
VNTELINNTEIVVAPHESGVQMNIIIHTDEMTVEVVMTPQEVIELIEKLAHSLL